MKKRVSLYFEESEYLKLEQSAKAANKSLSDFIRTVLNNSYKKSNNSPIEALTEIILNIEAKRNADEARRIADNEALRGDLKTIFQQAKITDVKAETVTNFVKSIKDDTKRVLAIQRCNLIYNKEFAELVKKIYPAVVSEVNEITESRNKK